MDARWSSARRVIGAVLTAALCVVVWVGFLRSVPSHDRVIPSERQLRETIATFAFVLAFGMVLWAIMRRRRGVTIIALGGVLALGLLGLLALTALPVALVSLLNGGVTPLLLVGLLAGVARMLIERRSLRFDHR